MELAGEHPSPGEAEQGLITRSGRLQPRMRRLGKCAVQPRALVDTVIRVHTSPHDAMMRWSVTYVRRDAVLIRSDHRGITFSKPS
ncbi:hypothetical protein E2C01_045088 [Portunus trituberculatus]|uniref:Uncharacterized protein n=1 Tax=Portunus trituberculatus TaxID=210409 RepID=A0A5B7G444_PORTR|nr:hypothetical protein [Portunus trituberculatus]